MKVFNKRKRGSLKLAGAEIGPGETAEVDMSKKQLKDHMFYAAGWMDAVEQPKASAKAQKQPDSLEADGQADNGGE